MSASAALMSAGANQQLVASKLQEGASNVSLQEAGGQNSDGSIDINHMGSVNIGPTQNSSEQTDQNEPFELPKPTVESLPSEQDDAGLMPTTPIGPENDTASLSGGSKLVTEPPVLGGELSANTHDQSPEPSTDPLTNAPQNPTMLEHNGGNPDASSPEPPSPLPDPAITSKLTPPPPAWVPPSEEPEANNPDQTLVEIEEAVKSPHLGPIESLDDARAEVNDAINALPAEQIIQPDKDLNAQPLGIELHPSDLPSDAPPPSSAPFVAADNSLPNGDAVPPMPSPNSPPPVPPPLPPNGFGPPPSPTT
jgi:hypothetical protein